jgi:hypothetical protein
MDCAGRAERRQRFSEVRILQLAWSVQKRCRRPRRPLPPQSMTLRAGEHLLRFSNGCTLSHLFRGMFRDAFIGDERSNEVRVQEQLAFFLLRQTGQTVATELQPQSLHLMALQFIG